MIPADGNGKLHCSKQFETECPEPQEGGRAVWNGHVSLSDDIEGWNFFAEYGCLPKHEMVDGTDRKTVQEIGFRRLNFLPHRVKRLTLGLKLINNLSN